jgi:hypothetical protein
MDCPAFRLLVGRVPDDATRDRVGAQNRNIVAETFKAVQCVIMCATEDYRCEQSACEGTARNATPFRTTRKRRHT